MHKPLILITSRVHPGEIGSSYALKGMIDFLTSSDPQAKEILNEFYFLIVPMLNPDGVYNGNNRMDALGQNLNRFYHIPDLSTQPSCYAIKSLVENTRR
jgi:murein tripeptide amidase MpaA